MKKILLLSLLLVINMSFVAAQAIKGKVVDEKGEPLISATVVVKEIKRGVSTNEDGKFRITHLPQGELTVEVSFLGYNNATRKVNITNGNEIFLEFHMKEDNASLNEIEVFGERYKQPEKLDAITRMPLRPSEQIQSISVISDKVIAEQGALTITEAMRNVPGVTLFGSYGGVRESMSARGFRGIPVLKNGVRMDSQFQTASGISDMQGVESIQMIKGSAAITQGVITDIGNAGGVINLVTKTPKFVNGGEVGIRTGSWGQFRPTFDVQSILDKNKTTAFRLNGAYERTDNYRPVVSMDKVYINPSFEWRPDDKTTVTFEMDYLNSNTTPVTSTVNFGAIDKEALYDMSHDKFLGFKNENVNVKLLTYAARINRKLTEKLSLRAAYFGSSYQNENVSSSLDTVKGSGYEGSLRARNLSKSFRDDKNTTFQLDLIGQDVYTGPVKHTFQLGFDYRIADATTTSLEKFRIDTIDVKGPASNIDNSYQDITFRNEQDTLSARAYYTTYGIMAQEVLTVNEYFKAILGLRYSSITTNNTTGWGRKTPHGTSSAGPTTESAWDPSVGIMVTPIKNLNVFASYTTSTSLRSAANILTDRVTRAGASKTKQWEAGIKSDWLDNRLRFNFTYFHILTDNLSNAEYAEGTTQTTGYYYKAGDLKRDGFEVELNGRILPNLQAMLGYAYLDARYDNSPSYVNGSAPMNAPKHTANGWLYYTVDRSVLKGLSVGLGAYYVGKRPVNEYSNAYDGHSYNPGVKPFDMPAYTTINVQLAYTYNKVTARVFLNNIFDEIGYNSYYRGGYINQIDPRNFAAVVSYRF
ncbi:MAG: TonB-dependent receptor [Dysgonomonas sp.]|nr:TonB-dependent receptor [Dysgonomonas sp.]